MLDGVVGAVEVLASPWPGNREGGEGAGGRKGRGREEGEGARSKLQHNNDSLEYSPSPCAFPSHPTRAWWEKKFWHGRFTDLVHSLQPPHCEKVGRDGSKDATRAHGPCQQRNREMGTSVYRALAGGCVSRWVGACAAGKLRATERGPCFTVCVKRSAQT